MKIPEEPGTVIFCGLVVIVTSIATTVDTYYSHNDLQFIKIIFGIAFTLFGFWLCKSSISEYKRKVELANRCSEKDKAKIKFIGIELRQGSTTNNYAFMILDYKGVEKRFTNLTDEIRIKYHKEELFPIFYNPNNPEEYVYDNIEDRGTDD